MSVIGTARNSASNLAPQSESTGREARSCTTLSVICWPFSICFTIPTCMSCTTKAHRVGSGVIKFKKRDEVYARRDGATVVPSV